MKIGIGLLTYKRPECLNLFLTQLDYNQPFNDFELHIEEDNKNIANGKNNCLIALSDCDYVFLFEDDCFVIKKHWDIPFIESGYDHLLYMDDRYGVLEGDQYTLVKKYADCSGCFMFMTKKIIKEVGYFNPAYDINGLEHVGYSTRIKKATNDIGFVSLTKTNKYLYSLDLQGVKDWKVDHSTTIDHRNRELSVKHNMPLLYDEINGSNLYYGLD